MDTTVKDLIEEAILEFAKKREKILAKFVTLQNVWNYELKILPNGTSYLCHIKTGEELVRFLPVEIRKLDEEGHYELAQKYEILKEV